MSFPSNSLTMPKERGRRVRRNGGGGYGSAIAPGTGRTVRNECTGLSSSDRDRSGHMLSHYLTLSDIVFDSVVR